MKSVALVIIGDELLNGSVRDENSDFLCKRIHALGSRVRRVLVLPDEVDTIAEALPPLSAAHDYVLTSGGVGPTPDDLTWEGVAAAFSVPLVIHSDLEELVRSRFPQGDISGAGRMIRVAQGTEAIRSGNMRWPLLRFRNLFILPGVPEILRDKFEGIAPYLQSSPWHQATIHLAARESGLAALLESLTAAHGLVELGSYPHLDSEPRLRLTLCSKDPVAVQAALDDLLDGLPDGLKPRIEPVHPVS